MRALVPSVLGALHNLRRLCQVFLVVGLLVGLEDKHLVAGVLDIALPLRQPCALAAWLLSLFIEMLAAQLHIGC